MSDDPHSVEEHDLGLQYDIATMHERGLGNPEWTQRALGRRGLLGVLGGVGAVALIGCGSDSSTSNNVAGADVRPSSAPADRVAEVQHSPAPRAPATRSPQQIIDVEAGEIPSETAGPFPGNGSNGPNVLNESGVVRRDITRSFGSASGVAGGVPLRVNLRMFDLNGDDVKVLAGAAVYIWQCDAEGNYSMYDGGAVNENYLRGVQVANRAGRLTFDTVFPGCYPGRWPHLHFEVYRNLRSAANSRNKLRTSQIALPRGVSDRVYRDRRYPGSTANLSRLSPQSDMVFSDGVSLQMAKVTGSMRDGYVASLNVPV